MEEQLFIETGPPLCENLNLDELPRSDFPRNVNSKKLFIVDIPTPLLVRRDTKRVIIGLSGFAGVGKDEVRKILENKYAFKGLAIADKLRELARQLDPYFPELGETYTSIVDRIGYEKAKRENPCIRQYLIKLGQGCRNTLGIDVWLNAALPLSYADTMPLVISDVRNANEAQRIQEFGGRVYRIIRPGITAVSPTEEESLAKTPYDVEILNDGTLEDLRETVERIYKLEYLKNL